MLKDPVVIGGTSFKMSNGQRKIIFSERCRTALAPYAHDPASRSTEIFPLSMRHRVAIGFAQEWLRQPRQISQRLRIDFSGYHTTGLHRR